MYAGFMQMASGQHVLMFGGALNVMMICAIPQLMLLVCMGYGKGLGLRIVDISPWQFKSPFVLHRTTME